MTWQRDDFEVRQLVETAATATKRGFGFEIEEPVKRRDHTMVNIVFLPALMIGSLVYLGVMGALLSVYSAAYIWLGWRENRALLIVLGLPWVFACRASYQRLIAQLDIWHDLQWRVRRGHVDADTSIDTPFVDRIERVDSGHLIGLKAPWVSGWKQKLAKRVYNQRGRWTGGDTVARDRLTGLYTALTENYETALDDLRRLGWLDGKKWTEKGKADILTYLFYGGNDG
jgi:hypothetical protein